MEAKKLYNKTKDPGKPTKRVIFVESNKWAEREYKPIVSNISRGSFDPTLRRRGSNNLYDELLRIKKENNIQEKSYEDGDEFVDKVFKVYGETEDFSKVSSFLKDTYAVDVTKDDKFKKAYAEATGYPNLVKYGIDNFKTIERVGRDQVFIDEANQIARASLEIDGIPAEIVPVYGEDEFNPMTKKYNKEYLEGADVFLLGHFGQKIAGMENAEWNSFLKDNMDKSRNCYGGICDANSMAYDFKDVPNFTGTINKSWLGIPRFKSYKGKGSLEEIYFSNSLPDNYTHPEEEEFEYSDVKVIKPIYGKTYANFQKNPEFIRDQLAVARNMRERIPYHTRFPQGSTPPLPTTPLPTTLKSNAIQKDGGKIQTMKNINKYQSGGGTGGNIQPNYYFGTPTNLFGDAGSMLSSIMGGVGGDNTFQSQTTMSKEDYHYKWLKDNNYKHAGRNFWGEHMFIDTTTGKKVKQKDITQQEGLDFDAHTANTEQFNKFLPLTQNLAGLFDLQQKEKDELSNRKDRVQDFATSYTSYAPVGFAKEGGGASDFIQSQTPALDAIMKLPKGISPKHRDMIANTAMKEAAPIINQILQNHNSPTTNSIGYPKKQGHFGGNTRLKNILYADGGAPPYDKLKDQVSLDEIKKAEQYKAELLEYINSDSFAKRALSSAPDEVQKDPKLAQEYINNIIQDSIQKINSVEIFMADTPGAGEMKGGNIIINPDYTEQFSNVYGHELNHIYSDSFSNDFRDFIYKETLPISKVKNNPFAKGHDRDSWNDLVTKEAPVLAGVVRNKIKEYFGVPLGDEVTPEIFSEYKKLILSDPEKYKFEKSQLDFFESMAKPDKTGSKDAAILNMTNHIALSDTGGDSVDMARNGGFFKRLGKGVGNFAQGVGNVAHDWGLSVADSFGNRLGAFDIDNDRYKTGFGRSVSGFNDKLQSTTGKMGMAFASAAVPGLSGLSNFGGNNNATQAPNPMPSYQPNSRPTDLQILLGSLSGIIGAAQPGTKEGMGMFPFMQDGGGIPKEEENLFFREAKDFHQRSIKSPLYKEKVKNSLLREGLHSGFSADELTDVYLKAREQILNSVIDEGEILDNPGAYAAYTKHGHKIRFSHGQRNLPNYIHELSHASTEGGEGFLEGDRQIIGEICPNDNVCAEEVKAPRDVVAFYADKYKIIDINKKVTAEDIIKIHEHLEMNKEEDPAFKEEFYDLMEKMSEQGEDNYENVAKVWNEVASNSGKNNSGIYNVKNGGRITKLQQILGYKDNSPYKNLPSQIINSNNITMDGVSKMLKLIPDVGQPIVAEGNSGNYIFPGASKVLEVPMAQDGGRASKIPKRIGSRENKDGSFSTHLMATETLDGKNWVSFPTLFQNPDSTWVDMSNKPWEDAYEEAKKRGEVVEFGTDKDSAIKFGEGSWKPKKQDGGNSDINNNNMKNTQYPVTGSYMSGGSPMTSLLGKILKAQEGGEMVQQNNVIPEQTEEFVNLINYTIDSLQDAPQGSTEEVVEIIEQAVLDQIPFEEILPILAQYEIPETMVNELGNMYQNAISSMTGVPENKNGGYSHKKKSMSNYQDGGYEPLFDRNRKAAAHGLNSIIEFTANELKELPLEEFQNVSEVIQESLLNNEPFENLTVRLKDKKLPSSFLRKIQDLYNSASQSIYDSYNPNVTNQKFAEIMINGVPQRALIGNTPTGGEVLQTYQDGGTPLLNKLQQLMSSQNKINSYQDGGQMPLQTQAPTQEAVSLPTQEQQGPPQNESMSELINYTVDSLQDVPQEITIAVVELIEQSVNDLIPFEELLPQLAELELPEAMINDLGQLYTNALSSISGEVPRQVHGGRIGKYRQGGGVFHNNIVANEDSKAKSYVDLPAMVPIQTEVKETVVLPTGDLVKVNATKRHSRMTDDEVTDVVPEGSYILSQFGDTKIYKDEAKLIPMEIKAEPYNLFRASSVPKVKTLADLMNKNVMSPADLSRVIENRFKIIDSSDPFTQQTNEVNKYNRASYLQTIIQLSEYDKARKGIDNSPAAQMGQAPTPQMVARDGGTVRVGRPLGNYSVGGVAALVQALLGGAQYFVGRSDAKKGRNISHTFVDNYAKKGRGHIDNAATWEVLSNLLQETEVNPQRFGSQYLDQGHQNSLASINNSMRSVAGDAFRNRMDTSSLTPQMANLLGSKDSALRTEALSKGALEMAKVRADLFNKYMMSKQSIYDNNTNSRINARNASNVARNAVTGNIGASLSGRENNLLNLEANLANTRVGIETGYLSNLNNAFNSLTTSTNNALATGVQAYNDSQNAALQDQRQRAANLAPQLNYGQYQFGQSQQPSAWEIFKRDYGFK